MQGFNQRQLEQLAEVVKQVIVQVLAEEKRGNEIRCIENVQLESLEPLTTREKLNRKYKLGQAKRKDAALAEWKKAKQSQIGAPGHYESKPTISEHLYNKGRFACCCEVCTCGEPKVKNHELSYWCDCGTPVYKDQIRCVNCSASL